MSDGKTAVSTTKAPGPSQGAPYSQAIRFGDLVFVAGQLPVDPATGQVVVGGIAEQTEQTLKNLQAVLEAAGSGLDKLLKTTVFLHSRDDWPGMNEVYARYAGDVPPARSAVEVGRLPADALIELEAIAHV